MTLSLMLYSVVVEFIIVLLVCGSNRIIVMSHAPDKVKRLVEIISTVIVCIVCALLMCDLLFYMLTIPF